jgi:hypothetical protein
MFVLSVYIHFGWIARVDGEKEENIDTIFVAGIHQSKRERERRENNITNEKIDGSKKYTENI